MSTLTQTESRRPWPVDLAARRGLYYGWVIVVVTFLALLVSAGVRGAPGVIILPLEREFGWDRAGISLAIAVSLFAYGAAGPISGKLIERFGPWKVSIAGIAVMVAGSAAVLFMGSLFDLGLWWGVLVGLGSGSVAFVLAATVATRWFVARRGLVTGILGAGASAGQLVFIPAMMALTEAYGWRAAIVLGMVVLGAIIFPLFAFFFRNQPADVGLTPLGAAEAPGAPAVQPHGTSLAQALRVTDFWLLAGSFFICGFTTVGLIGTHLIPFAVESGFSQAAAAGALALIGAMNIVGTTASGYLTDRYNPRVLLGIFYAGRGISLVLLPFIGDTWGLTIFAILFGLDFIATIPPTVALIADRFGRASVAMLFGWILLSHQLGAAYASYSSGLLRVWFGNYQLAFIAAGVLAFVAAALCLRISRPEKSPKPAPALA